MATSPRMILLYDPTNDERTNALLVHILAIFSGFIAPLIFYLVKKDSRFVMFHALQVLIWHVAYSAIIIIGVIGAFISMAFSMASQTNSGPPQSPPWALFGLFGFVWLFGMGGWVLNIVLGIIFAVKSNNGEWARYPIIGDFVLRKILPDQPVTPANP